MLTRPEAGCDSSAPSLLSFPLPPDFGHPGCSAPDLRQASLRPIAFPPLTLPKVDELRRIEHRVSNFLPDDFIAQHRVARLQLIHKLAPFL